MYYIILYKQMHSDIYKNFPKLSMGGRRFGRLGGVRSLLGGREPTPDLVLWFFNRGRFFKVIWVCLLIIGALK